MVPFLRPYPLSHQVVDSSTQSTHDYQSANPRYLINRLIADGQPKEAFRTRTGHLDNHFAVGPAILWSPFLLLAHSFVVAARWFGSNIPADGFSALYRFNPFWSHAHSAFAVALFIYYWELTRIAFYLLISNILFWQSILHLPYVVSVLVFRLIAIADALHAIPPVSVGSKEQALYGVC